MQNIYGLLLSIIYIFIILGIATLVAKFSKGASETSRKIVHILVGNWVFITPFFTELWAVILVPFTFIIFNSLSLKYNLIPAMERNDDSLGTVYYAISLFILSGAGFLLGWRILPFIGILNMAYGDGFAAIFGQKWGKKKPFSFAPKKSLVGSITVAIISFIVTFIVIIYFKDKENIHGLNLFTIIFISLLTGILSAFIELTGNKGCDNLTLPIGSGLFATLSLYFNSVGLFIYLSISAIILLFAYKMRAITVDGIVAAILTAITLYALGGPYLGASLLIFFILGSIVSKLKNNSKVRAEILQEEEGPRNWKQVICNSLPASILSWLYYINPETKIYLLLAFGVFSAAAADTFSSEIGMMNKGRVYSILSFKPVPNGLSGGVSILGLMAGILGSFILSLLAFPQFGFKGFIHITILGLLGTLLDSIIGASIQRKYMSINGELQDKKNHLNDIPAFGYVFITNNVVNLLTLSVTSIIGHLILLN